MKLNNASFNTPPHFTARLYTSVDARQKLDEIIKGDDAYDAQACRDAMSALQTLATYNKDYIVSTVNGLGISVTKAEGPKDKSQQIYFINPQDFFHGLTAAGRQADKDIKILEADPEAQPTTGLYASDGARERLYAFANGTEKERERLNKAFTTIYKASKTKDIEIKGFERGATVVEIDRNKNDVKEIYSYDQNDFISALEKAAVKLEDIMKRESAEPQELIVWGE